MKPESFCRATAARAAAKALLTSKSPMLNAPGPRSTFFPVFRWTGRPSRSALRTSVRKSARAGCRRSSSRFCALGTSVSSTARADEASADLGLTLNPVLYGLHESFNDRVHVPPVPIPLIEFRERYGPFELDLSGLPGVASVRSDDITQGRTSTQLSVFTGMLRVWDPLHRFSAGIGQTLYNQSTHYLDPVEIAGTGERQFSRVTGLTYQAGYAVPYHAGRFEAVFNYAPAMVGTQYTTYDVAQYAPRINPEKAGQIDTGVRYVHSIGTHSEAIIGLRYLNYTSSYVGGRGGLSDRNVGLLAVVGLRTRIGR